MRTIREGERLLINGRYCMCTLSTCNELEFIYYIDDYKHEGDKCMSSHVISFDRMCFEKDVARGDIEIGFDNRCICNGDVVVWYDANVTSLHIMIGGNALTIGSIYGNGALNQFTDIHAEVSYSELMNNPKDVGIKVYRFERPKSIRCILLNFINGSFKGFEHIDPVFEIYPNKHPEEVEQKYTFEEIKEQYEKITKMIKHMDVDEY